MRGARRLPTGFERTGSASMDSPLRIALISEHASPIAAVGGTDAGGPNVYVAHVARCLAQTGHRVDVLTRRDAPHRAATCDVRPRMRVLHIDAGPPCVVAKEELLPHMVEFGSAALKLFQHGVPYDVVHANFFRSGLVGLRLKAVLGVPLVVTFHALGAAGCAPCCAPPASPTDSATSSCTRARARRRGAIRQRAPAMRPTRSRRAAAACPSSPARRRSGRSSTRRAAR